MNEAVLVAIEEHALTPEAIEQVVTLTERDDIRDRQAALARERKDVERRISRLVSAIETAGDVASLAAKIRELEARGSAINRELSGLDPVPRLAPAVIQDRLADWRWHIAAAGRLAIGLDKCAPAPAAARYRQTDIR